MGKVSVLDCTLRDGGYINNWEFKEKAIKDIIKKISRTGIEYLETGFIKDVDYNPDFSIFNGNDSFKAVVDSKNPNVTYLGMVDMKLPMPLSKLGKRVSDGFDGVRVIFKKDKIEEGYRYCKEAIELGYITCAQLVGTNEYSDDLLADTVKKFNSLDIKALSIVDTFGLIEKQDFLRITNIINQNLREDIALGYHSHNNLQQAMGNAVALVEQELKRDIIIDACVFGMGRGAGNLNMELFVKYLNQNYGKNYRIEPFLEVIDEYLNDIYRREFWGYSLPFYLSATNGCHPNYAKFFAEKEALTVKAFNEILRSIPEEEKGNYSRETAEKIYIGFMQNYVDDTACIDKLRGEIKGRKVLLIGSGKTLKSNIEKIKKYIRDNNPVVVSLNYIPENIEVDYVFSGHMRRYRLIQENREVKKIITSNVRDAVNYDYMLNFSSYASKRLDIMDNSGVMFLKVLIDIGVKEAVLAGLDGYTMDNTGNYVNEEFEYNFTVDMIHKRNIYIKESIKELSSNIEISFLTDSLYKQ